jgi:hypothetical protein
MVSFSFSNASKEMRSQNGDKAKKIRKITNKPSIQGMWHPDLFRKYSNGGPSFEK